MFSFFLSIDVFVLDPPGRYTLYTYNLLLSNIIRVEKRESLCSRCFTSPGCWLRMSNISIVYTAAAIENTIGTGFNLLLHYGRTRGPRVLGDFYLHFIRTVCPDFHNILVMTQNCSGIVPNRLRFCWPKTCSARRG